MQGGGKSERVTWSDKSVPGTPALRTLVRITLSRKSIKNSGCKDAVVTEFLTQDFPSLTSSTIHPDERFGVKVLIPLIVNQLSVFEVEACAKEESAGVAGDKGAEIYLEMEDLPPDISKNDIKDVERRLDLRTIHFFK